MKKVSATTVKAQFSVLLDEVRHGKTIAIQYGKRKEIVAWLIPPPIAKTGKRPLGLLKGKVRFQIHPRSKMTEDEFLNS